MKKKTAIVTGGAGFIGSHMVDILLEKNFEVRIVDDFSGGHEKNLKNHTKDTNIKIEKIDIVDLKPNTNLFKDVDYVFHFAGKGDIVPSIEQPVKYMNTNILGTIKVLECARNSNIKKFVYAASSSCYGIADTPTNEENKIENLYPYALSKYQGEQSTLHWGTTYGLPVISIRIFNAYGRRVRTTGAYGAVFGVFLKQKLEKQPFTIVGDGNQKRDFLFVTDIASAFYKLAKSNINGEIFNLGAGKPQTINKLVSLIDDSNEKIYIPSRPGEPKVTWADITKIQKITNWIPKIDFETGVREMVKDISSWSDAPLWDVETINKATETWFKFMDKDIK